MTYEQLVEKVARAIWDVRGFVHSSDERMFEPLAYGEEGEYAPAQAMCQEAARAALSVVYEAMREPTIEMIAAFWRQKNTGAQETGEIGPDQDDFSCARALLAASPLNPEGK